MRLPRAPKMSAASPDLASPARDEQHPLRPWFPSREETYLRCILPDGRVEFF